ncbi:hypothetical protein ACLOJK_018427 [Asimina triloba]
MITTAPTVSTTSSSSLSANSSQRTSIGQIRVVHRIADVELTSDPTMSPTAARRRRQAYLFPPLIIAHFESRRHHHLIPIFMAHITGLDPTVDHHSSGSEHFLPQPIRSSILAEAICFVDGDNRLPPAPIRSVHQLTDIDLTLLSSIPTSFACCLADEFACIASHDKFATRCHRPLPPAATASPPFPARQQGRRQRGTITAAPHR